MEHLKAELTLVLGEQISRLETISEQTPARLYALYDHAGKPMPLMAKYYRHQGRAALEAKKLALLGHEGLISVPAVYGLVISQQKPVHEMLLLARLNGVSAEAPTRDATRWQQFCEQVVEGLLAWHRIASHGLVGTVDSTQENHWPAWFQQRVEVLWSTLSYLRPPFLRLKIAKFCIAAVRGWPVFFVNLMIPALWCTAMCACRVWSKTPAAISC